MSLIFMTAPTRVAMPPTTVTMTPKTVEMVSSLSRPEVSSSQPKKSAEPVASPSSVPGAGVSVPSPVAGSVVSSLPPMEPVRPPSVMFSREPVVS